MCASLTSARIVQNMEEQTKCFPGLGKLVGKRTIKAQEELARLVDSGQYEELEKLYQDSQERSNRETELANILVQILQVQEVRTSKEYSLNGCTFTVYVIEDTEL